MKNLVSPILLSGFNSFLERQTGLCFSEDKWPQFQKGIASAAEDFGFNDPSKCIQWLMDSPLSKEQVEILAGHLTVGESFFFRCQKSFDLLETLILPQLIRDRSKAEKKIRIWSAACSSGEEAYSIAMLLDRNKKNLQGFDTLILATDINRTALRKAKQGIYREWSFRGMPEDYKTDYFDEREKGLYEIHSSLKEKVVFDYLNLVENRPPALLDNTDGMDVIFCRNALIYFSPSMAQKVLRNLIDCLKPGGWLVLSSTESFKVNEAGLSRKHIPGAPIYRKTEKNVPMPKIAAQAMPGKRSLDPAKKCKYEEALEYYHQGFYMKTVEVLGSILSQPHENAMPEADRQYMLLARAFSRMGKMGEAERWCRKAIKIDRHNIQYRYLLATFLMDRGNLKDAAISLKQCLYIDEGFVPALFSLGNIAHMERNEDEAIRYFDKTLSLLDSYDNDFPVVDFDGVVIEGLTVKRMKELIGMMKGKISLNK
ncbi:MAG: hypothetical protein GY765_21405 [bacterium]|nr:hypothetical protein [bacterium]